MSNSLALFDDLTWRKRYRRGTLRGILKARNQNVARLDERSVIGGGPNDQFYDSLLDEDLPRTQTFSSATDPPSLLDEFDLD